MRRIVDDFEVVIVGDLLDGRYITWMSVAMHRQYGGGVRRDGSFKFCRVEIERVWIDVREHRLDAVPQQRMRGRNKGVRRSDNLPCDTQRLQSRDQGNSAIREEANVIYAQIFTERFFQLLMKWPSIGEYLVVPYLSQVWNELIQRW